MEPYHWLPSFTFYITSNDRTLPVWIPHLFSCSWCVLCMSTVSRRGGGDEADDLRGCGERGDPATGGFSVAARRHRGALLVVGRWGTL